MSLGEKIEEVSQQEIQKLKAQISNIERQYGVHRNAFRIVLLPPKARQQIQQYKERINELQSGSLQRAMLDSLEPLAEIGFKRKQDQRRFAKDKNKIVHEEREKVWEIWRAKGKELKKQFPHLRRNKSDLARTIKKKLELSESIGTIRHRL